MSISFARENANNISLELGENDVKVKAISPQLGSSTATISAKITGEKMAIAFNARFLLDCMEHIAGEIIQIKLISSSNPGLIASPSDPNFLYVVMPLKID